MKLSLDLSVATRPEWVEAVMADFRAFLQDHADCERKASAMAMSFVAKYPDRIEIIPELIATGVEELEHFQRVYSHMQKRGGGLGAGCLLYYFPEKDVYNRLHELNQAEGKILSALPLRAALH